jgi:hypothetical protein
MVTSGPNNAAAASLALILIIESCANKLCEQKHAKTLNVKRKMRMIKMSSCA